MYEFKEEIMKKFAILLTFTIIVFFCFSIVVFAEETQTNDVEKLRYVSEDLITEKELLEYIDEIKENNVNVTVSFTKYFWIAVIIISAFSYKKIGVKKKKD